MMLGSICVLYGELDGMLLVTATLTDVIARFKYDRRIFARV